MSHYEKNEKKREKKKIHWAAQVLPKIFKFSREVW
jgi:hypothetical protein